MNQLMKLTFMFAALMLVTQYSRAESSEPTVQAIVATLEIVTVSHPIQIESDNV
jgi:hypothetical protein